MKPVICMITAPIQGSGGSEQSLVDRVAAAARAGVHLIQIRQPHLDGRTLMRLVERAVAKIAGTTARVVVNDRVDVALEAGAHGVHLRGDSVPARRVRAIARRTLLVGRSVHAAGEADEVAKQGDLDYVIFGSVFATRAKPGAPVAGADALAAACRGVALPVLAVGGMTHERLGEVARAGAAGFAAIGMFADPPLDELGSIVREASLAFDTPQGLP